MNLIIAFVHLGRNPTPTLNWYARICNETFNQSDIVLLTDYSELHRDFPGRVISVKETTPKSGIEKFLKFNRPYRSLSGGYWRYTTERLFVLSELANYFDSHRPVMHMESDVLINTTEENFLSVARRISKTSIVRYLEEAGIASILISPSIMQLNIDLENLEKILILNPKIFSDMSLLGKGLNQGVLAELPSYPNADWLAEGRPSTFTIFDGAAVGQYLFGLDPVHTNNRQISGYINPNFDIPLDDCFWQIQRIEDGPRQQVVMTLDDIKLIPFCIHVHSKILIDRADLNNPDWKRFIAEANKLETRIPGPIRMDDIHSGKISWRNRIELRVIRFRRKLRVRK